MGTSNRPLSPHLQIYRLPLAAMLSIAHRATGVFLSIGTLLLVYWLLAIAAGPEAYVSARETLGSWFGLFLLFLWSLALFFHLCNGIRHLFWDAGHGFELETVNLTGKAVLVAAVVLTLITWTIGLCAAGGS